METKKLEKFQQEIANLGIKELQEKRKNLIKKRRTLFVWGVNGTWIGGLIALFLVLIIQDLGYLTFPTFIWQLLLLYLFCFLPFVPLIVRGLKTSDIWMINKRLHELGSEPEVIN